MKNTCKTCKHSYQNYGGSPRKCHKGTQVIKWIDPVDGTQRLVVHTSCEELRGGLGDCKGNWWEPTLWGRLKASIKALFSR